MKVPKKSTKRRRTGDFRKGDAIYRDLQLRALFAIAQLIGACVSMAHEFDIRRAQIASDGECGGQLFNMKHDTIGWLEQDARKAIDAYNAYTIRRWSKAALRRTKGRV